MSPEEPDVFMAAFEQQWRDENRRRVENGGREIPLTEEIRARYVPVEEKK